MVKVPHAGRVKTRLGRDIGMTQSAWWFRHQVSRLLREIRDPRWRIVLGVSPDGEGMGFRRWPREIVRIPQGRGDLGERMSRIFRTSPPVPTLVIGGDIPGVDRTALAEAFGLLNGSDAVIGPATDGGYWLIGLRHPTRLSKDVFADVRWSGPHARTDTIARLRPRRIATARVLADVDTAADLA